jgi:hypothetical protein
MKRTRCNYSKIIGRQVQVAVAIEVGADDVSKLARLMFDGSTRTN